MATLPVAGLRPLVPWQCTARELCKAWLLEHHSHERHSTCLKLVCLPMTAHHSTPNLERVPCKTGQKLEHFPRQTFAAQHCRALRWHQVHGGEGLGYAKVSTCWWGVQHCRLAQAASTPRPLAFAGQYLSALVTKLLETLLMPLHGLEVGACKISAAGMTSFTRLLYIQGLLWRGPGPAGSLLSQPFLAVQAHWEAHWTQEGPLQASGGP